MRITAQPRNTCNRRYNKPLRLSLSQKSNTKMGKRKPKKNADQQPKHGCLFVTVYARCQWENFFPFLFVFKHPGPATTVITGVNLSINICRQLFLLLFVSWRYRAASHRLCPQILRRLVILPVRLTLLTGRAELVQIVSFEGKNRNGAK